jgi:hypothetical protein
MRPDTAFVPAGCDDSADPRSERVSAPYNLMFALSDGTDIAGLFDAARRYWKSHGYKVGTVNLQSFDPRLHAVRDDYELVLHVVPSRHMGYLGGGTPCLPER